MYGEPGEFWFHRKAGRGLVADPRDLRCLLPPPDEGSGIEKVGRETLIDRHAFCSLWFKSERHGLHA